jgi:hypothetical protein
MVEETGDRIHSIFIQYSEDFSNSPFVVVPNAGVGRRAGITSA